LESLVETPLANGEAVDAEVATDDEAANVGVAAETATSPTRSVKAWS